MKIESSGKVHFTLLIFIRVILFLGAIGSYYSERWLVFFVAMLALFVTFIPWFLKKKFGVEIPAVFEIMIILFIYGILFLGEVRGFFSEYWWWDVLLNLFAAVALGFVGLTILYVLYKDEKIDASPLMISVFAFCFAFAIGSLWEIFEFTVDNIFGFQLQRQGLVDTMEDLIVDAVGALFVSIGGYFYIKSEGNRPVSGLVMRFMSQHPNIFKSQRKAGPDVLLKKIIKKGEGNKLEFKSTLRVNLHTGEIDKKIELGVLKTLVAYLNSEGGTLLVGVSDDGKILGMEKDNFLNEDKLKLHFTNMVKHRIGNSYLPFIKYELIEIDGKHVLQVDCKKGNKPVFLKLGQQEEFYVRSGPSSARLDGRELVDYVRNKFG